MISYSLSPFEQQAFPNYFTKGIPNVLRRIQANILRVAPRECPGRGRPSGAPLPVVTAGPSRSARLAHVSSLKMPQGPLTSQSIVSIRKLSHGERKMSGPRSLL